MNELNWNIDPIEAFTDILKLTPSKDILNIKESLRTQRWEAKADGAYEDTLETLKRKIHACDDVLKSRPKFSVTVEKLSYNADGPDEKLHNLPATRTVDLYVDILEHDFTIATPLAPWNPQNTPYPLITSKKKINKILDLTFRYGQNDFQSKQCPSVSVGDVIHLKGKYFRVASVGFQPLTVGEYTAYKDTPARDRTCFGDWKS